MQLHVTGACELHMAHTQDDSQYGSHSSSQPDNSLDYFAQVLSSDKVSPSQQQVKSLKNEMTVLLNQVQTMSGDTNDCEVLKAGIEHVRSAITIMKALQSPHTGNTLVQRKRVAPNTNHELQPRFTSTKKKRTTQTQPSLAKPTTSEMEEWRTNLADTAVQVCALCFREDDQSDQSRTVHWIQCSQCCTWVHSSCIVTTSDLTQSDYTCDLCV